jgi:hypothetical protein
MFAERASRMRVPMFWLGAVLAGALVALGAILSLPRGARATSDPPVAYYYPYNGWAAQSHAEGHDGYGASNFPTWYGGSAKDGGEDACSYSNRYSNIQSAGSISTSSTSSTAELPDWSSGLVLSYVGCGVSSSSRTLITTFMSSTWGGTPGYTYHNAATGSQCSSQGLSSPCGDWATTSQVEISWWNSASDSSRQKLLLHEWGHAWNLDDYCNGATAMMNNGISPCNWPSSGQYYAKDRDAFYITYGY